MKTLHVVTCLACLAGGCGSGAAGSLDGKVQGHEIAVKEAIFIPLPNGETFVAAADQEDLCAIMNGQKQPTSEMNLLEVYLMNWNGSAADPLVTGPYVTSRYINAPGKWSYSLMFWTRGCIAFTAVGPNSGTITLENVGLAQAGGQTQLSVDLTFGDAHLSGHLTATYCALASAQGTACQPQ